MSVMKKIQGLRKVAILSRIIKTVKILKVTFEQNSEEGEEVSHVENWKENLPGRERTKRKGPEMESVFRE